MQNWLHRQIEGSQRNSASIVWRRNLLCLGSSCELPGIFGKFRIGYKVCFWAIIWVICFQIHFRMLDELGMDLVYEERFCDAFKRYARSREGKNLMQRMRAAETFSLKERSNSDHDQREYKHATKFLEEKFPDKIGEQIVSFFSLGFCDINSIQFVGNDIRVRMGNNINVSAVCIQETWKDGGCWILIPYYITVSITLISLIVVWFKFDINNKNGQFNLLVVTSTLYGEREKIKKLIVRCFQTIFPNTTSLQHASSIVWTMHHTPSITKNKCLSNEGVLIQLAMMICVLRNKAHLFKREFHVLTKQFGQIFHRMKAF